jgi:hypothetical protein
MGITACVFLSPILLFPLHPSYVDLCVTTVDPRFSRFFWRDRAFLVSPFVIYRFWYMINQQVLYDLTKFRITRWHNCR